MNFNPASSSINSDDEPLGQERFGEGLEPELQGLPPRRVEAKTGRALGNGCVKLFIMPHTIVGVGWLFYVLIMSFVALFGTTVPGRVTSHETGYGYSYETTYYLNYDYQVGEDWLSGKQEVSGGAYRAVADNSSHPVQILVFKPNSFSLLMIPGANHWSKIGFLWLGVLFWNSILSVVWRAIFIAPLQAKRLLENGAIARGVLTRREIITGSYGDSHCVYYRWTPPGHSEREEKTSVQSDEYLAAREGQNLTILFHPHNPKLNVAYRYAAYRVVN